MSNNKQSSVEWLQIQLKKGIGFNPLDPLSYPKSVDNLFQQAKEMEKDQMIKFARYVLLEAKPTWDGVTTELTVEEYYNEKFGGNNEQQ